MLSSLKAVLCKHCNDKLRRSESGTALVDALRLILSLDHPLWIRHRRYGNRAQLRELRRQQCHFGTSQVGLQLTHIFCAVERRGDRWLMRQTTVSATPARCPNLAPLRPSPTLPRRRLIPSMHLYRRSASFDQGGVGGGWYAPLRGRYAGRTCFALRCLQPDQATTAPRQSGAP